MILAIPITSASLSNASLYSAEPKTLTQANLTITVYAISPRSFDGRYKIKHVLGALADIARVAVGPTRSCAWWAKSRPVWDAESSGKQSEHNLL